MDKSLSFCKEGKKPLCETPSTSPYTAPQSFSQAELNRILVFRHIEKTQPTTRYKIAKETRLDKTTVRLIVRDLVFAGVVHEKNVIQENDRPMKILSIPTENSKINPSPGVISARGCTSELNNEVQDE